MITATTMYKMGFIVLLIGTAIESFLFFAYGFMLMFYIDDPREFAEAKKNFFATVVCIILLGIIWGTGGRIIDYILGV